MMIFDVGPGSLSNLRRSRLDTERLTTVFISHCHADHISDLIPFLWAIQIDGRRSPLQIYGPIGFRHVFEKLRESTNTPDNFFTFPLSVTELQFGENIRDVRTCRTDHSIPTLAFRVEMAGKSLCYTADTIYSPSVNELAQDVDLLVHEATFLENQASIAQLTRHSTARMAGRSGRASKAKKLALFHIPPPNEHREEEFRTDATQEYGSNVLIASDLSTIEI
jgi:ribonuclease BN (tRNA processing enzyme)